MKTKRYWLRGLVVGIAAYTLLLLIAFIHETIFDGGTLDDKVSVIILLAVPFLSPLIPVSLLVGWLYGKIKNTYEK